jgi:hypothetical protein
LQHFAAIGEEMKNYLGAVAVAAVIAGCGGGGSDAPTSTTSGAPAAAATPEQAIAAGLWTGTTNTNRAVTGLVLGDGTYYVLYSVAGVPANIAGVVQGTGSVTNNTFSSGNGRDFNLESAGILPATVSASVSTKQNFNGAIAYSNSTVTFTTTYDAQFEVTPTLAAVAGTYSGQVAFSQGIENATITVSSSGAITGAGASTCGVSGSVVPRTDGNAYNVTVSFGGAPCYFAGQSFSGIAYYDSDAKQLYAAAPNSARTDGVLFVGSKN